MTELEELRARVREYDKIIEDLAKRITALEFAAEGSKDSIVRLRCAVADIHAFGCRLETARSKEMGVLGK
jgi:hypothetical protein